MSVSSQQAIVQFTVATSPQTFAVPFYFIDSNDLAVYKTVGGVDTLLVLNTDYTVSGAGTNPPTGTIIGVSGAVGATLTIYRAAALVQPSVYTPNAAFPAKTQETGLDRLTMLIQQLTLSMARAVRVPITSQALGSLPVATRSGALVGFDAAGDLSLTNTQGLIDQAVAEAGAFAGGTVIEVATISALKAVTIATVPTNFQARVLGYYAAGDGGGGTFYYSSGSSTTDNGGTVIQPTTGSGRWLRVVPGYIAPEMFGMKGDGATDDYTQWKALIAWVNAQGGGIINFRAGAVYLIDRHIVSGNGVTTPAFSTCNGLTLNGNGCIIRSGGGFNRAVTSTQSLSCLTFSNSSNIRVANFELDGSSNTITKSGGVTEGSSYGLAFTGCEGVSVENIYTHNNCTDGLYFDDSSAPVNNPLKVCKRVSARNVKSYQNARQGMSIVQLRGGTFENCEFSFTGTDPVYGAHAPQAGVDIEPGRTPLTTPPNQTDMYTGEITFISCRFFSNAGTEFSCTEQGKADAVTCINCQFITDRSIGTGAYNVACDIKGMAFIDCYMDSGQRGHFFSNATNTVATLVVTGCTIRGDQDVVRTLFNAPTVITGCRIFGTSTDPINNGLIFRSTNTKLRFTGNYIFVPKEMFVAGGGDNATCNLIQNAIMCGNNRWETDLPANQYGATTANYNNDYTSSGNVFNETFKGTAVGVADTIKPRATYTWDTNYPYASTPVGVGHTMVLGSLSAWVTVQTDTAAPTTGAWRQGSIVFHRDATAGGKVGWVCTAAGTPGTWKEFGAIDA